MARYFLHIAYDGTEFHGWQRQANAHSVQAEIEEKLSRLFSAEIPVVGCGRTDTGVHARNFYLHFDYLGEIENRSNAVYRLNQMLPKSIFVYNCLAVEDEAHARFDARSRTYKYFILQERNPFNQKYAAFFPQELDLKAMQEAASRLKNYTDFTSFSKLHTDTFTNDCAIQYAKWYTAEKQLVFEINANRFLRNMVRAIVGTCIEVGKGKITIDEFCAIIDSKNRQNAGHSVPAKGLFLEQIEYPFLKVEQ